MALLRYFGERIEPCGNCDVCLDPTERVDATRDAQKMLSAAYRTGERFGAAHLIDIVRGARTEKALRFGHHRLPTFGVGADRSANAWRSVVRQMVAAGYLRIDIAGYGALGITDTGREMLRGDGAFLYREDTAHARGPAPAREPSAGRPEARERPLDAEDAALLSTLKALRLELARERGVPAYVVFPDRALIDMARRRPRNEAEFAQVNGVGAVKLEQFAGPFLAAINAVPSDGGAGAETQADVS